MQDLQIKTKYENLHHTNSKKRKKEENQPEQEYYVYLQTSPDMS